MVPEARVVRICALRREGIDELEALITRSVMGGHVPQSSGILLSNVRHIEALKDASRALGRALRDMNGKLSLEFVSEEIKTAVNALDGVTGRNVDVDLLDKIFARFCIGK